MTLSELTNGPFKLGLIVFLLSLHDAQNVNLSVDQRTLTQLVEPEADGGGLGAQAVGLSDTQ